MAQERNLPNFNTYGIDELPAKIQSTQSGIVNLMGTPQGSHWVAFYNHPQRKHVIYFDSFGIHPDPRLERFLKSSGKRILSSTTQIQHIASANCGAYSIRALDELNRGKELWQVISEFDALNQAANERELAQ